MEILIVILLVLILGCVVALLIRKPEKPVQSKVVDPALIQARFSELVTNLTPDEWSKALAGDYVVIEQKVLALTPAIPSEEQEFIREQIKVKRGAWQEANTKYLTYQRNNYIGAANRADATAKGIAKEIEVLQSKLQ